MPISGGIDGVVDVVTGFIIERNVISLTKQLLIFRIIEAKLRPWVEMLPC